MTIAEKIRNFLAKLQSLSENKKRIILWTIVAVMAVIMGFFWFGETKNNLSKVTGAMKNVKMPEIKILNVPTGSLKTIEDKIKQNSTTNTLNKK